jgi:hypothetical protein
MDTVLTVYPSLNGILFGGNGTSQTWSDLRDTINNAANPGTLSGYINIEIAADATAWDYLTRSILIFDTSTIPVDAIIKSAILTLYGRFKQDDLSYTPDINIYSANPASDVGLVTADYLTLGSTAFANPITYADWQYNISTPLANVFTLNTVGKAAINKGGKTRLGIRNANRDVANSAPVWANSKYSLLQYCLVSYGDPYRPKLVVTYTRPKMQNIIFI